MYNTTLGKNMNASLNHFLFSSIYSTCDRGGVFCTEMACFPGKCSILPCPIPIFPFLDSMSSNNDIVGREREGFILTVKLKIQ